MNYPKRIAQLAFLFAIIWLTIQNYNEKVNLMLFNKELKDVSVILIVFFSVVLGSIIATFFASIKDMKRVSAHRKLSKENKKQGKELELLSKDLKILQNDLEHKTRELEKKESEVKTLKEIISMPEVEQGNYRKQHLIE